MSLIPNLKKIFQESLEAKAGCPKCGIVCKCPPVVEASSVNLDLEKGAAHEQKEHGLPIELARKLASDHIREHPGYYAKMAQCGLDEELSTDPAAPGSPNAAPTPAGSTDLTQGNPQGKDPSQVDPKTYAKYKAEAEGMDKKIDNTIKQLQTLRQSKAQLAQKYGINPQA